MASFKDTHSFESRKDESNRIKEKFPGRVPIIVERAPRATGVPVIDKSKFLVPSDLSVAQFVYVIRKRLTLPAEQALFLFVGGTLPTTSTLLRELYSSYADADGFLYCHYSSENTFGAGGGGDEREERRASRGEESEDKEIETASSR